MKISGKVFVDGQRFGSSPTVPPAAPCVVSDLPRLTGSQKVSSNITADYLITRYGARPGTKWFVQYGRWTMPRSLSDVGRFNTEPGTASYWLNGRSVQVDYFDTSSFVSYLNATSSVGFISTLVDPETGSGDPFLMVAYTAGVRNAGLEMSYPQDRTGDTSRHPAVELFFNGSWRHGRPVDADCKTLVASDYQQVEIQIPGGVSYDETGGHGSFGDTASTVTTRGAVPAGASGYPALVSNASGLTYNSPVTDMGFTFSDGSANIKFKVFFDTNPNYDGTTPSPYEFDYDVSDYETLASLVYLFNRKSEVGLVAEIVDGRMVVYNTNPGKTVTTAFDFTNTAGMEIFQGSNGTPTVQNYYRWMTVSSTNTFTLATPLAQFAPKGLYDLALEQGGCNFTVTPLGYIEGNGSTAPVGAPVFETMGDLVNAINATGTHLAYLESGRLVVVLMDPLGGDAGCGGYVEYILRGRYSSEAELRDPSELLFGASDHRFGADFRYTDQNVSIVDSGGLIPLVFSGGTIPVLPRVPQFPQASTVLGTRSLTRDTLLSTLYPTSYLLRRHDVMYDNFWQLNNIEVSNTTTVGDLLNYIVDGSNTLRFVDNTGEHQADAGYLRHTSGVQGGSEVVWFDPVTRNYGPAVRLFTNSGDDGTVPTNITGTAS